MPLTFYYASGSPYAWRVWLALEYKAIAYELRTMSFSAGDLRKPDFLALNPRGKVPAIVDEGFALYESVAILEYLDEKVAGPKLFPGEPRERAQVRRCVQEADHYCAPTMETLADEVMFKAPEQWDADKITAARQALVQEVELWERLITGEWLAGTSVSAADFTLYPLLALTLRIERKKPDLTLRGAIGPAIAAWMRRFEALPICQKTWPPHWK